MDDKRGGSKAAIAAEAWGALLDLTMGQRNRFFGILQEFGLTPGDLRALFALDHDTPRPMRTLARAWACDASNVTWMVDRLESRGLVERRMLPSDRRVGAGLLGQEHGLVLEVHQHHRGVAVGAAQLEPGVVDRQQDPLVTAVRARPDQPSQHQHLVHDTTVAQPADRIGRRARHVASRR